MDDKAIKITIFAVEVEVQIVSGLAYPCAENANAFENVGEHWGILLHANVLK